MLLLLLLRIIPFFAYILFVWMLKSMYLCTVHFILLTVLWRLMASTCTSSFGFHFFPIFLIFVVDVVVVVLSVLTNKVLFNNNGRKFLMDFIFYLFPPFFFFGSTIFLWFYLASNKTLFHIPFDLLKFLSSLCCCFIFFLLPLLLALIFCNFCTGNISIVSMCSCVCVKMFE